MPNLLLKDGFVKALEADGWEVWQAKKGQGVYLPRGVEVVAESDWFLLARRKRAGVTNWHSADYDWFSLDIDWNDGVRLYYGNHHLPKFMQWYCHLLLTAWESKWDSSADGTVEKR